MTGQHRWPRHWFRAPRGRTGQPEHGRHSLEHRARAYTPMVGDQRYDGLEPVGHAGREPFDKFMAAPAHRNA